MDFTDRYTFLRVRATQMEHIFQTMDPVDWSKYGSETDVQEMQRILFGQPVSKTDVHASPDEIDPSTFGLLELYLWNAGGRIDDAIIQQYGDRVPFEVELGLPRMTLSPHRRIRRQPFSIPLSALTPIAHGLMHTSVHELIFSHPKKKAENNIILSPVLSAPAYGCVKAPASAKQSLISIALKNHPHIARLETKSPFALTDMDTLFPKRLRELEETRRRNVGALLNMTPKVYPILNLEQYYTGQVGASKISPQRICFYSIYLGVSLDFLVSENYLRYADHIYMRTAKGLIELTDPDVIRYLSFIITAPDSETERELMARMNTVAIRRGFSA